MHSPDPYEFDASLLKSWRVLVVEDDADSLDATVELFQLLKQQVVGVNTAQAAIEALEKQPFDILCTDINLPDMSGISLSKLVLAKHPGIIVVYASGYGSSARNAIGSDVNVLAKPFGLADIMRMLVRIAERPGAL